MALVSLLVSVLTTGFVSGTLSYDYDTDPQKRAFNPNFYGFVSDAAGARALLLMTIILLSSVQVIIKSILVVVLAAIAGVYVFLYIGGDLTLYLTIKILRADFSYFLPLHGWINFFVSALTRVVIKLVSDFTGCLQFRHPYDVGGLYFTFNIFSPLFCLVLLLRFGLDDGEDDVFRPSTVALLTRVVLVLGVALLVFMGMLIVLMNEKYRGSFFSIETGGQMTRRLFLEGDDVMRAEVFNNNELQWAPIRKEIQV